MNDEVMNNKRAISLKKIFGCISIFICILEDFENASPYFCTFLATVYMRLKSYSQILITLVNVNAPVVATTSWWLHFTAPVVA